MDNIQKPSQTDGKLGVLIVGLNGEVSTTFLAGTFAIRKGLAEPIGSLSQMAAIRLGKREENRFPLIKDFVPLADLNDLVFGGWDIRNENCYDSAIQAGVLQERDLNKVRDEMEKITPMTAVFEQRFVTRLKPSWTKKAPTKFDYIEMLREDIRNFKEKHGLERVVVLWCASTEIYLAKNEIYNDLRSLEEAR